MKSTLVTASSWMGCFLLGILAGWLIFAPSPATRTATTNELAQLSRRLDEVAAQLNETVSHAARKQDAAVQSTEDSLSDRISSAEDHIASLNEDTRRNTSLLLRLAAAEDARYQHLLQAGMRAREVGDAEQAIEQFTRAIAARPELFNGYLLRGHVLTNQNRYGAALADFEAAKQLNPQSPDAWNNIAWIRATCPDGSLRDGEAAVASAEQACQLTQWQEAAHLSTLAAAYAQSEDFDAAVRWQKTALENAVVDQLAEMRRVLALYQNNTPYRERPPTEAEPAAAQP